MYTRVAIERGLYTALATMISINPAGPMRDYSHISPLKSRRLAVSGETVWRRLRREIRIYKYTRIVSTQ